MSFSIAAQDFVQLDNMIGDVFADRPAYVEDWVLDRAGFDRFTDTFPDGPFNVYTDGQLIAADVSSARDLEDQVMAMVEGSKISDQIAEIRGKMQEAAGGTFEVDRDVDDLNDALAAAGILQLRFVQADQDPNVQTTSSPASTGGQEPRVQPLDATSLDRKQLILIGGGLVVAAGAAYMVIR